MSWLVKYVHMGIPSLLVLTLYSIPSQAQPAPHPSVERMKKDITYLAGDECEGRGVETQGINKAADYIAAEFKSIGLKPALKDGSYFQPFKIKGLPKLGTPNHLVFKGPESKQIEPKINSEYTVSGLSAKGIVNSGIIFVGYGITIGGEKDYDDYRGVDVKDKIVMILRQTPRAGQSKTFPKDSPHASLTSKLANAHKHKAAGVIFVNDSEKAAKSDPLMPFDYARGQGPTYFPTVCIHRTLADELLGSAKKKLADVEAEIDKEEKPQSFEIPSWKADIETTIDAVTIDAKNIIGVLEGAGPLANETVVIGAHYDHLGRGETGSRSPGSKAVHFGADDNGSGTTSVIELARRFAAVKDRQGRRIVFMLFSGEERGLLGSAHYCNKDPIFPLKDTVAMINLDMVGRLRPDEKTKQDKLEIGGVGSAKSFDALVEDLNKKFNFKLTKTKSGTGPSDHTSFYQGKVPVFFLFTGFHEEYHKPTDKPDLINLEGMEKICDMVQELVAKIASDKDRPEYVAGMTGKAPTGLGGGTPKLGFMPAQYDDAETNGVPVGGVTPGGAGDKGGMKKGDWIVAVAGHPVKNMEDYMKAMSAQTSGKEIEITVKREEKKVKLKVIPQ
jgi:hypothetical protein